MIDWTSYKILLLIDLRLFGYNTVYQSPIELNDFPLDSVPLSTHCVGGDINMPLNLPDNPLFCLSLQ